MIRIPYRQLICVQALLRLKPSRAAACSHAPASQLPKSQTQTAQWPPPDKLLSLSWTLPPEPKLNLGQKVAQGDFSLANITSTS